MKNYGAAASLRQVRQVFTYQIVREADFRNSSFIILHYSLTKKTDFIKVCFCER